MAHDLSQPQISERHPQCATGANLKNAWFNRKKWISERALIWPVSDILVSKLLVSCWSLPSALAPAWTRPSVSFSRLTPRWASFALRCCICDPIWRWNDSCSLEMSSPTTTRRWVRWWWCDCFDYLIYYSFEIIFFPFWAAFFSFFVIQCFKFLLKCFSFLFLLPMFAFSTIIGFSFLFFFF